jgi:hypothetical protein
MLDKLYSLIKARQLFIGAAIAILIASGCASRRFAEKPKEEDSKGNASSLAEYEKTFNPVDYDQEIVIASAAPVYDTLHRTQLEIPKDTVVMQEEAVQGFRIQVFSSSGVDEANLVRSLVQEKFSKDSVYVEYDAPVYKIRVGDFINRYEANQRLPEFIEKGYRDAWIVPDRIVQRKLVRISIPKKQP